MLTDGRTYGRTDARLIAISPEPFGRGVKYSRFVPQHKSALRNADGKANNIDPDRFDLGLYCLLRLPVSILRTFTV